MFALVKLVNSTSSRIHGSTRECGELETRKFAMTISNEGIRNEEDYDDDEVLGRDFRAIRSDD